MEKPNDKTFNSRSIQMRKYQINHSQFHTCHYYANESLCPIEIERETNHLGPCLQIIFIYYYLFVVFFVLLMVTM